LYGIWEHTINAIIPDDADFNDYAGDHCFRALLCRVYPAEDPE
jgi:hypothetical protein